MSSLISFFLTFLFIASDFVLYHPKLTASAYKKKQNVMLYFFSFFGFQGDRLGVKLSLSSTSYDALCNLSL
ncbi:uncharacterized protein EV154DRAFT_535008 [Mucor mucedo]|uniref:uncharacterized protein n=1 Tax=Mucor mucedo TaxID=29922 RepID=UPI00221FBB04|nr:uncharacterized protein EV154DRAFT_535008 [Mucor mucedo]KAI7863011.1 hypothetical protein EV154DRAFT_535008 [Mucor mucedo]